jgi:4-amino-4-deoxy-L-arabinose transferase-like glycosyltransferase
MRRWIAALLASLFLFVHVIRLPEPLGVDQGLFACFTRWVPRGWLPYRDLFDSKPPLFLYWWGLARVVPGELPRAVWWFEAIWLSATLAIAYAFSARLHGRIAGLATATLLAVGLWSPVFGGFWSRAQAEELLALPALVSAWLAWRAIEEEKWAFHAGLLAGLCGLFKIPSMAIAGAWAFAWFAYGPTGAAVRKIARALIGVAIPWALAFAWFAAHGSTRAFVDAVFVYHRYNAAFIAPSWTSVFVDFGRTLLDGALLPLVAALFAMWLFVRRDAKEMPFFGAWIVLTLAAIVLQRQLAGYHYLLAIPALSVAGGYAISLAVRAARRSGKVRLLGLATLGILTAIAVRTARDYATAYGPGAALTFGKIDRSEYLRRIQQGTYSNATEEEAARFLRERTDPARGILVWGLSPGIYALADRHPTTRYPFHKILFTEAPLSKMIPGLGERRSELLARLAQDPPEYILVGRGDSNGFEPMDSHASLQRWPELRELLVRDYWLETRVGRFFVHKRR